MLLQSLTVPNVQKLQQRVGLMDQPHSGSSSNNGDDTDNMKQSRHARRLYIGSIPQNYANEELLTRFLNYAISLGLDEDPEVASYILSVYMNPKKYFAFVELNSVDLTTACLEIDGILFYGNALKIQRADEYKPDLLAHTYNPKPLRLDLSKIPFFSTPSPQVPVESCFSELSTIIQDASNKTVEPGSLAFIGFPYDENIRHSSGRMGCGNGPKYMRKWIRKIGSISNPEIGTDLSHLTIVDKGDVPPGLLLNEAYSRLIDSITSIIYQGSIPIVIGGTSDVSYCSASALMAIAGGNIGVLSVDAYLNADSYINPDDRRPYEGAFRRLLEDRRFCPPRDGLGSMPSCEGRFVTFGAQGMLCSNEHAQFVTDRGGNIQWLGKDVRTRASSAGFSVFEQFKHVLNRLGENSFLSNSRRPVCVCIHMRAINGIVCPGVSAPSTIGFNAEEILEMCFYAGANQNVALIDICDFNPDVENIQTGRLVAEMVQQFLLGVTCRFTVRNNSNNNSNSSSNNVTESSANPIDKVNTTTANSTPAVAHTSPSLSGLSSTSTSNSLFSQDRERDEITQLQQDFLALSAPSSSLSSLSSTLSLSAAPVLSAFAPIGPSTSTSTSVSTLF
eukprot:gene4139-8227_t